MSPISWRLYDCPAMMISVVGGDPAPPEVLAQAEALGRELARRGCTIVCGGRGGVMEAACRGAKKAGGITVGILPSADGRDVNRYVDVMITTGMGYARNSIVVSSADAVIAINGSTGTLSEIGMALNFEKPVVVVEGSGGIADKIKESFKEDGRIRKIVKSSAEGAVKASLDCIK